MATYTMVLKRYDRHVPFFTGSVKLPPGIDIQPLEVGIDHTHRDGRDRHERMIRARIRYLRAIVFILYHGDGSRCGFHGNPGVSKTIVQPEPYLCAATPGSIHRPISPGGK